MQRGPPAPGPWIAGSVAVVAAVWLQARGLWLGDALWSLVAIGLLWAAYERSGTPPTLVRSLLFAAGSALVVVGSAAAAWLPAAVPAVVAVAAGIQLALAAGHRKPDDLAADKTVVMVPALAHGLGLLGSLLLVTSGPRASVPVLWICALLLLALHGLWVQRRIHGGPAPQEWERSFLLLASLAVLIATAAAAGASAVLRIPGAAAAAGLGVLAALAVLAGPPRLPGALRVPSGSMPEVGLDALVFVAVLNALLVALLAAVPGLVGPLFVAFTTMLVLMVAMEYAAVVNGWVRRRPSAPGVAVDLSEVTVVITAKNEAAILAESLPSNLLHLPRSVHFVLAPAATSRDATLHVARRFQDEDLGRVQVCVGPGTSKAVDLSIAWRRVATPLVLLLDADEVVDAEGLTRAVARMQADPAIGVLQGRKVGRAGDESGVARFAESERRFSTVLDHPFQSDVFHAAHFAGSAALMRREVPGRIGYWNTRSLTEDIEFTLRLHRAGDIRLEYDRWFIVFESVPTGFASLARQRARWARGWDQVTRQHFVPLVRDVRRVGMRRLAGLTWQLFAATNAPLIVFLPAITVLWYLQGQPLVPSAVAWGLAAFILPSRGLAFVAAAALDPYRLRGVWWRWPMRFVYGYVWVGVGWLLQLHASYLEVSQAPRTWHATTKRPMETPAPGSK